MAVPQIGLYQVKLALQMVYVVGLASPALGPVDRKPFCQQEFGQVAANKPCYARNQGPFRLCRAFTSLRYLNTDLALLYFP